MADAEATPPGDKVPVIHLGRRTRPVTALVGAVALVLGVAGCGGSSDSSDSSAGSGTANLRIGYTNAAPNTYDPHSGSGGGFQVIFPAYDTLLHVDENGDLQPWLATDWNSPTATELDLTLRDDVEFSDGTAFDADAVKANIEYARDIATGSSYQPFLKNIQDVQVASATEVKIILAEPNPGLAYDFSQLPGQMVSPAALENPEGLASAPSGSGPYELDTARTRSGTVYVWTKRSDYWAEDTGEFPWDTITITVNADPAATRNQAQAGQIDILTLNPGDTLSGFDTVNSNSGSNAGFTGAWLDISGTTQQALADPRVRQALNYAVDRDTIADTVYEGAATPVPAVPVTEDSVAYTDDLAAQFPFDPERAQELLAEAGFADGFPMQIIAPPVAETYAQAMAGNLRDVGIDAQVRTFNGSDIVQATLSGDYEAGLLLSRPTGQPGQDFSGLFTPAAYFNTTQYDDPMMDQMLSAAASETDADAQASAYQELADYASGQSWFLGTVLLEQINAFKSSVVTVTPPPFGDIFLYHYRAAD